MTHDSNLFNAYEARHIGRNRSLLVNFSLSVLPFVSRPRFPGLETRVLVHCREGVSRLCNGLMAAFGSLEL